MAFFFLKCLPGASCSVGVKGVVTGWLSWRRSGSRSPPGQPPLVTSPREEILISLGIRLPWLDTAGRCARGRGQAVDTPPPPRYCGAKPEPPGPAGSAGAPSGGEGGQEPACDQYGRAAALGQRAIGFPSQSRGAAPGTPPPTNPGDCLGSVSNC